MKKLGMLLLTVLVLVSLTSVAFAAKPGDQVTVNISVTSNPGNAYTGGISFSYPKDALTFISLEELSKDVFIASESDVLLMNLNGISTGSKVAITFAVKENTPAGTYRVSASGYGFTDVDEQNVSVGVSGGSVTVEAAACKEHTWDAGTVTTAATCGKEGVMTFTCTACGEKKTEAIPALDHTWDKGAVTTEATCTTDGVKTFTCTECGEKKTEPIPATGHTPSTEATRVEPTCTKPGSISYVCTVCGEKVSGEEIPPIDHAWGKGVVTVEATCTENGMKTYTCTACGEKKTEPIPATGHTPSNEATRIEPTCTKPGSISYACTVCGEKVSGEVIPAKGHSWDAGVATTKPTCETDGVKTITCTACGEKKTEVISKLGHAWDKGNVTMQPTCTTDGVKTYTCANGGCTKTEVIPAKGHTAGEWVETKPATNSEEGEQKRYCTVCGEVLETQTIARKHPGYNMTVCSVGPRFRDVSNITTEWDMFTPIDISEDGVQRYDLIAGNMHVIGEVILTVADGSLTVTYEIPNGNIRQEKDEDFLSILPSLSSVESLDRNSMTAYKFGEPISIADDLGGDTKVLLYVHNRCNYSADTKVERFFGKGEEYTSLVEAMSALMD